MSPEVSSLLLSLAVLITIVLTMTLGILCGYAAVMGLLRAFGHRRQTAPPAPALAATTASGD